MRSASRLLSLGMLLVCGLTAQAQHAMPNEQARQRFDEGRRLFQHHDYEGARLQFEAARALVPLPELSYNIGLCWDRMGQVAEALREYHRYLDATPEATSAAQVRSRVAVLETAVGVGAPLPVAAPAPRRPWVGPVVLGAAALTSAIVGTALVASVKPEFDRLQLECGGMCPKSRWAGLESRANAGYVLWGLAGALAIGDAVWWILEFRAGRGERWSARAPRLVF